MSVLSLRNICVGFGGPLILDQVTFQIKKGERVCLVGRNGEGKSTLMNIISGELSFESGQVEVASGIKISKLTQDVPQGRACSVYELVFEAFGDIGQLMSEYHRQLVLLEKCSDEKALDALAKVQHEIEARNGWDINQQVEKTLSQLSLSGDVKFSSLSGGMKRRVLLAKALAIQPDLLLLDEPTNHLDIEYVQWMENFFLDYRGALLFITHDRLFLQNLATRIVELDRGQLSSWPGDYQNYLRRKEERKAEEITQNKLFDQKLAQEEVWIRQGIKARRTRNEGRVRALKALRKVARERRAPVSKSSLAMQKVESSGKLVIEAVGICQTYDGEILINDFSTLLFRGDKVGIIGPNGSGKSTLLKILLDRLSPDKGTVRLGTNLEVAYFDQLRDAIDGEKTVLDNVADNSDQVTINGQSRHVISYLQDFMFTPERARTPAKVLSGGEKNRLLLAKLFTKPCNVLVLDEPTNDLDIETLELLEELLIEYKGTLLLVSHDREFLNNVVTSTIVLGGGGKIDEYVGGYDDWIRQRDDLSNPTVESVSKNKKSDKNKKTRQKKNNYKESRELVSLPEKIEKLENELESLQRRIAAPEFYQQSEEKIKSVNERLASLESALSDTYQRWEALEN